MRQVEVEYRDGRVAFELTFRSPLEMVAVFSQSILSTHSPTQQGYVVVTCEERPATPASRESGMGLVLPTIAAYHVPQLPIVQAEADKLGVVEVINQWGP